MNLHEFSEIISTFNSKTKNLFQNIFDEPMKKFYSDMRKNIKILSQDMQRIKPDNEQLVKLY